MKKSVNYGIWFNAQNGIVGAQNDVFSCYIVFDGHKCTADKNTGDCCQFDNVSVTLDTEGGSDPKSEDKTCFLPKIVVRPSSDVSDSINVPRLLHS